MGTEVRGSRSTNRWLQNSHGEVKYRIGNAVAKELIHMTHGHEQWWEHSLGNGGCWVEEHKGKKSGQV